MLAIRDLVKVYPGPVAALQGVDLDVPKGMFGLLGPNGAGKTTLMRIVAGLLEPTSGTVTLDGVDVVADPSAVWRQLGYLPQEFGFYPHLTGVHMLAYLLKLKGVEPPAGMSMKKLCLELLDRVNLSFAARRKLKGYSGGMKQRLAVAQAIAGDPRLIIVDEPTAGLDPEERLRFYRILAELAEDRIVLLSTHIVEDVAVLCQRFAVIRDGRLIAVTSPTEAPHEELDELRRTRCVTQALLVEGQNLVRIREPSGDAPPRFEPAAPTLEDAYLLMMRNGEMAGTAAQAGVGAPEATP
ncbi:MAG: ATP-binding cassette domain-containing protein [Planctomycetota bacterium]|jgi:ABC-type multidrug transport system ATPase subunit